MALPREVKTIRTKRKGFLIFVKVSSNEDTQSKQNFFFRETFFFNIYEIFKKLQYAMILVEDFALLLS